MARVFDIIVVGGGCFGWSTALAMKRHKPDTKIIVFDGIHTQTASKDINKIVRTTYPDEDYIAFAREAMKIWQDPEDIYRKYCHETGWVLALEKSNKASPRKGVRDTNISSEEMCNLVGSRVNPDLKEDEELWLNKDVSYVDAAMVLEAVAETAVNLGVERRKESVTKLIIIDGECTGVAVGEAIYYSEKTIVATGAWTPKLLEKSNVGFPPDFLRVTGVGVGIMSLEEEEFKRLESMPILVSKRGEVMISREHKVLKVTTTRTFDVQDPDELDKKVETLDIKENRALLAKMIPEFSKRHLQSWICLDLMTPFQHPLLDEVPGAHRLILAVGGSYHGFKFLPLLGSMVTFFLNGESDLNTTRGRLLRRWRWDRRTETKSVHGGLIPK